MHASRQSEHSALTAPALPGRARPTWLSVQQGGLKDLRQKKRDAAEEESGCTAVCAQGLAWAAARNFRAEAPFWLWLHSGATQRSRPQGSTNRTHLQDVGAAARAALTSRWGRGPSCRPSGARRGA